MCGYLNIKNTVEALSLVDPVVKIFTADDSYEIEFTNISGFRNCLVMIVYDEHDFEQAILVPEDKILEVRIVNAEEEEDDEQDMGDLEELAAIDD